MIRPMFAVFDEKSKAFGNPFTSTNNDTAKRSFNAAASDPKTEMFMFSSDYTLYCIGEYDDNTGVITPLTPLENLGKSNPFAAQPL